MKLLSIGACLLALGASAQVSTWSASVDSRTADQWMAESSGRVYAQRDGHLTAFNATTGALVWATSEITTGPASFAKDALAAPSSDYLLFFDPRTGAQRARIVQANVAFAGSNSFIVSRTSDRRLSGFDGYGRLRWSMNPGAYVTDLVGLGGNLVAASTQSGALFIDASNGKPVASASDVDELVGTDGRYVWYTVRDGGVKGLDLDNNHAYAVHNQIERGQVRVEHGRAVAIVGGRLTIIDLSENRSTPFHIYGRWIGGPINDTILIERGDGLYTQRLDAGSRPIRISSYESEARYTTSDRSIGYVGLRNGSLLAVDMEHQRLLERIATGCDFYEGLAASGSMAIVQCDAGKSSRIVAFARPH